MSNQFIRPYEISVWEDVNAFEVKGTEATKTYYGSLPDTETLNADVGEGAKEILQYYTEKKLCVIGSNTMETPISTFDEYFTRNTNGSSTLNFSIYYKYLNDENMLVDNPFVQFLVNERKVKLRYGAVDDADVVWKDYVIKSIQENSETRVFSYTLKDLFINELSKTGFNLEFDTELENNMGTVEELGAAVLEESDWKLEAGDTIQQYREEPLYEMTLKTDITAKDMESSDTISIATGQKIYVFYSVIEEQKSYFQFLFNADGYTKDENRIITNSQNWYIDGVEYENSIDSSDDLYPAFALSAAITNEYRGKRLVRQQLAVYDTVLGQYVYQYRKVGESEDKEYYGYTKSEYISPAVVLNYIVNPTDYVSDTGWEALGGASLNPTSDPPWEKYDPANPVTITSILEVKFNGGYLYNSCLYDNRGGLNNFYKDAQYIVRLKLYNNTAPTGLNVDILEYDRTSSTLIKKNGKKFFSTFSNFIKDGDTGYYYAVAQCTEALSYVDLYNKKAGMFFSAADSTKTYQFTDIQFFPLIYDGSGAMCVPGGEIEATIKTCYMYYAPDPAISDAEAIVYDYKGYEESSNYIPKYDSSFEKIRSIEAKESNCFNILQSLCETFECWADFRIEHDNTGKILLEEVYEDGALIGYRQKKYVRFREYIGQNNYVGFRYGQNLKSIQRTLDSESIATKLVVKANSNEFADNGFCTIARSDENPTRDTFLYNFIYYINQGMIDFDIVNGDLYLEVNGYLGYYKKLRRLNIERDLLIEIQSALLVDVATYDAQVQTYATAAEEATLQLEDKKAEIKSLTGWTYDDAIVELQKNEPDSSLEDWTASQEFQNIMSSIMRLQTSHSSYAVLADSAQNNLDKANTQYGENADRLQEIVEEKLTLNKKFYTKYSRYIQEGSWISEDYIDDDLYYIDAESTLYNAAFPKTTYTINTYEISQLEGYENYRFDLGDITYIEDTEFFGWNENGRPYQEEVVVNEITTYLRQPDKNTIKVQNYKSSFADLFQRITATTNAVQYQSGAYSRAASVVETDGSINSYTMQMSLESNAYTISNAKDQSVIWDETGITTSSPSDPSNLVRIVNGGVFLSSDGGATWSTGISGRGISANYITVGTIDTSKIIIRNSNVTSFRWDSHGINAYSFDYNKETGQYSSYGNGKFVRFDQFGLYGINGAPDFAPSTLDEVRNSEYLRFGLTWDGFIIRSDGVDGYISITSDNDFEVITKDGTDKVSRVKIGRLDAYSTEENGETVTKYRYGIRISDAGGTPVMQTKDDGTLWLTDTMYVGAEKIETDESKVQIGYLGGKRDGTDIHEVIHAGDTEKSFIVYEDGYMKATGAEFTGTINATGGKIGNMTIGDVEELGEMAEQIKKFDISSEKGYNFKVGSTSVSPESITLVGNPVGFTIFGKVTWEGSNDFATWEELQASTELNYILKYEDHRENFLNATYYVRARCTDTGGNEYKNYVTVMALSDGEKGEDAINLVIVSSNGNYFRNNTGSTTLTAKLFKGGAEIDDLAPHSYTYQWVVNGTVVAEDSKTLTVTADDVNFSQTYICNVSKKGG